MKYTIPDVGELVLDTIVSDLNGTLSVNGVIADSTVALLKKLQEKDFSIVLLTGDHRGTAQKFADDIAISLIKAKNGEDKRRIFEEINNGRLVSVGNARIDIGTFEGAALSIATLQAEEIHINILSHVDVLVPSIDDELNFVLDNSVLEATMRV